MIGRIHRWIVSFIEAFTEDPAVTCQQIKKRN